MHALSALELTSDVKVSSGPCPHEAPRDNLSLPLPGLSGSWPPGHPSAYAQVSGSVLTLSPVGSSVDHSEPVGNMRLGREASAFSPVPLGVSSKTQAESALVNQIKIMKRGTV